MIEKANTLDCRGATGACDDVWTIKIGAPEDTPMWW